LAALVPLFHDIDYRVTSSRVRGLAARHEALHQLQRAWRDIGRRDTAGDEASQRRGGSRPDGRRDCLARSGGAHDLETADVLPVIFETLTRDKGEARILPWLATQFRIEDGGLRYWFQLRDDATFHDDAG
jgi:ABC-type transport system substrate-binding protein